MARSRRILKETVLKPTRGITLIEVLAFLALLAVIMLVVIGGLRIRSGLLSETGAQFRKDFQALYFQALNQGDVIQVQFQTESQSYVASVFVPPEAPPPIEDFEAYRDWEERQEEKQRALEDLGMDERRALTQLQRGIFEKMFERALPEGVRLVEYVTAEEENSELPEGIEFLILPTGEFPSSLWVFQADDGEFLSFVTNGLTGHMRSYKGRVTREEWMNAEIEK